VRRVTITKPQGGERHLGVPTVADRVVQAAVKLVIEPVFEADFSPVSYGFRPRRSALQGRERVRDGMRRGLRVVVDADIKGFFDHLDHQLLLHMVLGFPRRSCQLIRRLFDGGLDRNRRVCGSQ
jgi:RNA-directed DNA polymerase